MPGPTRRRKVNQGITSENKKYRTKRRRRDIDQIVEDLEQKRVRLVKLKLDSKTPVSVPAALESEDKPELLDVSLDLKAIEKITPYKELTDLPGHGQHYCLYCARHFIDAQSKSEHERGKVHKKRVKETKEVPYSIKESEKAGGLGSYTAPPKVRPEISDPIEMEL